MRIPTRSLNNPFRAVALGRLKILAAASMVGLTLVIGLPASAADTFIVVASTTSTQNSGLYDHILPIFRNKTGIEVRVVAVGTGQAIRLAERGDADVLLVHHKASEERFVADGFGVQRHPVMYNDFVIVGPGADPVGVKGVTDAAAALAGIAEAKTPFASRGDNSGTHKAERMLWKAAKRDVDANSGAWYRETGSGMGTTLNTASGMGAYTLTDRGTWLNFKNRGDLVILVEGDPRLHNEYGAILVNPDKHPHVKEEAGQSFIDWLISKGGRDAITNYRIHGEQLFFVK
uniref:Tungstate transport system substrate-binding protein n=1 Tax=Candidatus Kentrum eta TaxID=2126337 RepID=A0A450VEK3_9GAMM|nr:MAG: tungstate transport system substrate-binding protein [Candidatus Kentron sp. H]VFJ98164.1 MAG: tungstate transport system substrate-binding protein [Candidatus Kentron sp. H]VFK03226.1 MAG: tungstate transport system substrate-binding protein [Candidatus Kentron sp. H]